MTHIAINARYAGTCYCSRTFFRGARINYDPQTRRVVACFDCVEDRKAETMRRLQAAIDPTLDATRQRL